MIIRLGIGSPQSSSGLPALPSPDCSGELAGPTKKQSLFSLAPRGVCRAFDVAIEAVGSYPAVSPLLQKRVNPFWSGLFSVALSVGSPLLPVRKHACPMVLGLSSLHSKVDGDHPLYLPDKRHSSMAWQRPLAEWPLHFLNVELETRWSKASGCGSVDLDHRLGHLGSFQSDHLAVNLTELHIGFKFHGEPLPIGGVPDL